jgi:hypothetical protein
MSLRKEEVKSCIFVTHNSKACRLSPSIPKPQKFNIIVENFFSI